MLRRYSCVVVSRRWAKDMMMMMIGLRIPRTTYGIGDVGVGPHHRQIRTGHALQRPSVAAELRLQPPFRLEPAFGRISFGCPTSWVWLSLSKKRSAAGYVLLIINSRFHGTGLHADNLKSLHYFAINPSRLSFSYFLLWVYVVHRCVCRIP